MPLTNEVVRRMIAASHDRARELGVAVSTAIGTTFRALWSRVRFGVRAGGRFGSRRSRFRCTRRRKLVAQLRKDFLQHDNRGS